MPTFPEGRAVSIPSGPTTASCPLICNAQLEPAVHECIQP